MISINTIVPAEEAIRNPDNLRKMNLGQLGSRIEYSLHQWFHLRFSKKTPYGLRLPLYNPVPDIDTKWDDLSYQWLGDFYSSHVNPVFWRIHGWVEDRLNDWKVANNITEIHWNHTWVGGPAATVSDMFAAAAKSNQAQNDSPADIAADGPDGQRLLKDGDMGMEMSTIDTMEKVVKLLMTATGCKESSIYKPVRLQTDLTKL